MHLPSLIAKARRSRFRRWMMNELLSWTIPFNRPHGFNVKPLVTGGISVEVPYWRINRNHIRGIHACAMATAAEMCSGLSVMEHLDPKEYRMIMRTLRMDYHYQAKKRAVARCIPAANEIQEQVLDKMTSQDSVDYSSIVEVRDIDGQHLATGTVTWQVKSWKKVRTKR